MAGIGKKAVSHEGLAAALNALVSSGIFGGSSSGAAQAAAGLSWIDCTAAYARYEQQTIAAIAAATEAGEEIPPLLNPWSALLTMSKSGARYITAEDGVYLCVTMAKGAAMTLRGITFVPEELETVTAAVLYIGAQELHPVISLRGKIAEMEAQISGKSLATQTTVNTLINSLTNRINNIQPVKVARELVHTNLSKFNLPVVNGNVTTTKKMLKIGISNADYLLDNWDNLESVQLHLMYLVHQSGKAHHWIHPTNHDGVNSCPADKGNEKLGYGTVAGTTYKRTAGGKILFPPVPAYMQNSGFVQTEISLDREDLERGYIVKDPTVYFLPMAKPDLRNDGHLKFVNDPYAPWGEEVVMMTTRTDCIYPVHFRWLICVDGERIGWAQDEYVYGFNRTRKTKEDYGRVEIAQDGTAALAGMYSSIK